VAPAELAVELHEYEDPLVFAQASPTYRRLREGYLSDLEQSERLEPFQRASGTLQFLLPAEAWARRVSGTLANQLAQAHRGQAIALLSPKAEGGYLVSVRVPEGFTLSADEFCRRFPSGGGRRTAAGINHLDAAEQSRFSADFEREFRRE